MLKKLVDQNLPSIARTYRIFRDMRQSTAHETPLVLSNGLKISGEESDAVNYRNVSQEMSVLLAGLSASEIFIDVGANIGLFSCIAAQRGIPTVAFEPSAKNLRYFLENVRTNGLSGLEVLPIAVARQAGVLTLYGAGQGASLVRGWGGIQANYENLVPVNSLDNILLDRLRGKRALIKVDVEGFEAEVLRGAANLMMLDPAPLFMIEIGFDENFPDGINRNYRECFAIMDEAGFLCYAIEGRRTITLVEIDDWVANGERGFYSLNFLFLKSAHYPTLLDDMAAAKSDQVPVAV